jgi:hypothetical protein
VRHVHDPTRQAAAIHTLAGALVAERFRVTSQHPHCSIVRWLGCQMPDGRLDGNHLLGGLEVFAAV